MATQNTQELKLLFALFDVDNSGTLTKEELKQLLQSPNPDSTAVSEQQVDEYLKLADSDNSGDISVDEFIAFVTNDVPQGTYGLQSIFRTIDTDGNGSIEKSEFEQAKTNNKNLNQTLVNILDQTFQQDANSQVTYEQFVQAVTAYFNNLS